VLCSQQLTKTMEELNIAATIEVSGALSPEELVQKIAEIRISFPAATHPLFLLFTGSKGGDSGLSWCPDCTRAAPVVFATLEEFSPASVLLILNCERAEYRDPTFTYRVNEDINLTSVPTFMRYQLFVSTMGWIDTPFLCFLFLLFMTIHLSFS
jgi:hypothetical protein